MDMYIQTGMDRQVGRYGHTGMYAIEFRQSIAGPLILTVSFPLPLLLISPQGIQFVTREGLKTPLDFARLWLHEASRVYGDKMIDTKDMETFKKMKFDVSKQFFEVRTTHIIYTVCRQILYLKKAIG